MKKLLIIVALVGTLIPTAFTLREAGGLQNWQGVLPKGQVDSLYYYARIQEVADGYPLIGNPYFFEHRDTFTPGFFLPDIVSALPTLVGIPFDIGVVINMFVWSAVFLILSFSLLKLVHLPRWWAFFGAILSYMMAFAYVIRPTSLQLIYPVFLAFLIVLIRFLYEPLNRHRWVLLSVATALSFYVYTLLSYLIFIIFALIFFWFLFRRRFRELRTLVMSGVLTSVLLIPYGIYTIVQMSAPYYFETWARMGAVFSRIPAIEVYYYGRWIIIGLTASILLWIFFPKKEDGDVERRVFWLVTGVSLFAGLVLNTLSGIDVSLAIHTGRFFFVWMTLILVTLIHRWYVSFVGGTSSGENVRKIGFINGTVAKYVTAICIILLSIGVVRNIPPGPSFFGFNKDGSFADTQGYGGPLWWLEKNVSEQSVIWANDSISAYVPIMTRHYVLFHRDAAFHIFPDEELKERYLLSRSLEVLTVEDLKEDLVSYTGLGSYLQPYSQDQWNEWKCVAHIKSEAGCPPPYTDIVAFRGEEYFENLAKRFSIVKENRSTLLKRYNVTYLVVDRIHDDFEQSFIDTALYDDGRFAVIPLPF